MCPCHEYICIYICSVVCGYLEDGQCSPISSGSSSSYFRELGALPEHDLLIELVKDIASDLDLVMLCTKIMRNVGPLMSADRSSLFLVEGRGSNRRLVSKVFDISEVSILLFRNMVTYLGECYAAPHCQSSYV